MKNNWVIYDVEKKIYDGFYTGKSTAEEMLPYWIEEGWSSAVIVCVPDIERFLAVGVLYHRDAEAFEDDS